MVSAFEIFDKKIIKEVLDNAEFGTLAICKNDIPYSVPINFVQMHEDIYFHGSKKGRKIEILKNNPFVSFSVVESYSIIQSYFSSKDELACPATQFFKSVIIEGKVEFIENYEEKTQALSFLMKKLQKEGGYKPLSEEIYQKTINTTTLYKLVPDDIRAKFKFGQHLNEERFNMIIEHLEKRGDEKDINTVNLMKSSRNTECVKR